MPAIWIIYALLSAFFASLVAIFGKIGISKVDPTLATTVRSIIMAVSLIVITVLTNKIKDLNLITNKSLTFIFISGLAGALSWIFYFLALKNGSATAVSAIDRLSIAFVFIFSLIFLQEEFSIKTAIGVLMVTLGAIVISIK